MPRRRRQQQGLERVLGTPALFATAYGNVGSSIYYALGVTAVFALGLTPIVFVIAGLIFAATAATYAEGTVRYPEAGGSSSFARHAFNELVSFGAAWAQMLVYVVDRRHLGVLRAALPLGLLGAAEGEPVGHRRRRDRDRAPGRDQHRRSPRGGEPQHRPRGARLRHAAAARRCSASSSSSVLRALVDNVELGVAPTWSQFFLAIPIAMLAYTGVETVSNLAEEVRDPVRNVPQAYMLVAGRDVRDLPDAAADRALGAARLPRGGRRLRDAARPASRGGRLRRRPGARRRPEPRSRGLAARRTARSTWACSPRRSSSSPRTRA